MVAIRRDLVLGSHSPNEVVQRRSQVVRDFANPSCKVNEELRLVAVKSLMWAVHKRCDEPLAFPVAVRRNVKLQGA